MLPVIGFPRFCICKERKKWILIKECVSLPNTDTSGFEYAFSYIWYTPDQPAHIIPLETYVGGPWSKGSLCIYISKSKVS